MNKGNKIVINVLGCIFIGVGIFTFFLNQSYGYSFSIFASMVILTIGLIIVTTVGLLE